MKKLLTMLAIICAGAMCTLSTNAATYSEVISQTKPCAVLIYADWADDIQNTLSAFGTTASQNSAKYNFATLNIADEETKKFNKVYHIYPNLPYVLLFKDKGKVSRLLKRDCVESSSCFQEKLNLFAN